MSNHSLDAPWSAHVRLKRTAAGQHGPFPSASIILLIVSLAFLLGCDGQTDDGGVQETGQLDDTDTSTDTESVDTHQLETSTRPDVTAEPDVVEDTMPGDVAVDDVTDTQTEPPVDTRVVPDEGRESREISPPDGFNQEPETLVEVAVDEIDPVEGPTTGGTEISVLGSGFTEDTEVFFDRVPSTEVVFVSEGELLALSPPAEPGTVSIKVANQHGFAALPDAFTFVAALTIENVSPTESPVQGGVPMTIQGTGFLPDSYVSVGGRGAFDVYVADEYTIEALTPPGQVGAADVRVTNANGTLALEGAIVYYQNVAITTVFPSAGPIEGGQSVEIVGEGFSDDCTVTFSGRQAIVLESTPTSILVSTPNHVAGPKDVSVTTVSGTATLFGGYTYLEPDGPALEVLGVHPTSGPASGGIEVVVSGRGLDALDLQVFFGQAELTILAAEPNAVRGSLPRGPVGTVDVMAVAGDLSSTLPNAFTYYEDLTIVGVDPPSGPISGGSAVTVAGSGFEQGARLWFGPMPALDVVFVDSTTLTALTPPGSVGAVDVRVTVSDASATLDEAFVYTDELTVEAISPTKGSIGGGTLVTIHGRSFSQDVRVLFDGLEAASVVVLDPSTITCFSPPHQAGVAEVTVIVDGTELTAPQRFVYFNPASRYGGVWGDSINGVLNVTVLTYPSGAPIDAAFVMLTTNPDTHYQGSTDINGQITFTDADLSGRQTITASKEGYESGTIVTVDAQNATIFLQSQDCGG